MEKRQTFNRFLSSTSQVDQDPESWTTFPFLVDDKTVHHVARSRVMFVMRGLPGSGKSTIVRQLEETYEKHGTVVTCSADDYFLQETGTYHFQQDKLPEAHAHCQERARAACEGGVRVLVIDNTHVRRWEMGFYLKLASQYSYTVVVVSPKTPWRYNPTELAKRNKHQVPEDQLRLKLSKYESVLPVYFGWFLNAEDSSTLATLAREYFRTCLEQFPAFRVTMLENSSQDTPELTFCNCYSREGSSTETLHCTAFFSNRGRTRACSAYSSCDVVRRSLGKAFTLNIVGFVFTPKTCGARVVLTPRELRLWGKDDFEGASNPPSDVDFGFVSDSPKKRGRRGAGGSVQKQTDSQRQQMRKNQGRGRPRKPNQSEMANQPGSSTSQPSAMLTQPETPKKAANSGTKVSNPFAALMDSDSDTAATSDSEDETGNADATSREHQSDNVTAERIEPEDAVDEHGASDGDAPSDEEGCDDVRSDASDVEGHGSDTDDDETLAMQMKYVRLSDRPRFLPTQGIGSRAHVTLGHARGASAVQTGLDQVSVVELEQRWAAQQRSNHSDSRGGGAEPGIQRDLVELKDAALCCYDNVQCVLYLNEPISMSSLFSGRY